MTDLLKDAAVGLKTQICGKEVECIHVKRKVIYQSPQGPSFERVTEAIYAYLDNDSIVHTISIKDE